MFDLCVAGVCINVLTSVPCKLIPDNWRDCLCDASSLQDMHHTYVVSYGILCHYGDFLDDTSYD